MAISYATTPFQFVDSQFGSASNQNVKSLVNVAIDRRYHKEVQKKMFFMQAGMIGPDTYSEGGPTGTAPGYPVVRKTQLVAEPGDTLKMGLRKNLSFGVNTGKTGATQLVDAEVGPDFSNQKVKIEQWRQGVRIDGGMNSQRNPYESFEQMEMSLLSDWRSQVYDTSLLYAAHYGYGPHLFREYGHTNLPPVANGNTLIGNDTSYTTSRTIADIQAGGQDSIKAITFELGSTYCQENDFDPVMVNGEGLWVVLISPRASQILYRDPEYRAAMQYARERGASNPLFKSAEAFYSNCVIYRYDKIRSILGGNNPAGLTVAAKVITEASYTGIGGGLAAANLTHSIFLGANALMAAEGRFTMAERIRSEDDYGQIIGRAVADTFGCKRADWIDEAAAVTLNQSSLEMVNTLGF